MTSILTSIITSINKMTSAEVESYVSMQQKYLRAVLNGDMNAFMALWEQEDIHIHYSMSMNLAIQYHKNNIALFIMRTFGITYRETMTLACEHGNAEIARHLHTNYDEQYNIAEICNSGNFEMLDDVILSNREFEMNIEDIKAIIVHRQFDFAKRLIDAKTNKDKLLRKVVFFMDFDLEMASLGYSANYNIEDAFELLCICFMQTDMRYDFTGCLAADKIVAYLLNKGATVQKAEDVIQRRCDKQKQARCELVSMTHDPRNDWPNVASIVEDYVPFESEN